MKPNKKQRAIIELLGLIEVEGLWYAICSSGIELQVKAIKDKTLAKLVSTFESANAELEDYLDKLQQEVEPFMEDFVEDFDE